MSILEIDEIDFLLGSLRSTIKAFNEYQGYPSEKFRKERIAEAKKIQQKLRDIRREI